MNTDLVEHAASCVTTCDIWARLGIRLSGYSADHCGAKHTSFEIRHPSAISYPVPPGGVVLASMKQMTCSFYLQADMIQEARSARWPQSVFEADEDRMFDSEYDACITSDHAEIDDCDLSDSGKRFYNEFEARQSLDGHSDIPTAMKDLIHAAMYSLLIGSCAVPRIEMIKEMQSPSLLILAPQVFNMKHLAAVDLRSRLLPRYRPCVLVRGYDGGGRL
ncbi:hypothetical protein Cob_v003825 [Colletotrichum orbiculare MAFF 240422]|uniref:Uncharacterized protein n=1 Tax=Colletotrichum orbiculare (strain 104-T / ATCC 96160 / CBS 514.97 / LARS 414 / MAFF 240422) TaxID=1213857 RepID=A0A484FZ39_COLOR|nr:hypothetical protein Cob_v003825 [Colletotrichum orbiculare MAFF 240422]